MWPITPQTMETLRVADQSTLAPLIRQSGEANSDFFPTLDLNSERTRFMKSEASGFAGLPADRVNFAAMMDHRRLGLGDSYSVIDGVPRLQAMAIAAAMKNGDSRAGARLGPAIADRQAFEAQMASGRAPSDWHAWVETAAHVEAEVHGGMAGVADSAYYAELRAFLAKMRAPAEPRAAVDFMHGLAAWDFSEASRASEVLLTAAAKGDLWLDPDALRDGAVMAKLETGDRRSAFEAFKLLIAKSSRTITDLRTRLLYSYIADTTRGRLAAR